MNSFLKSATSHDALTENMALSHSTTGALSLDYFNKAGTYRDRSEAQVAADLSSVWGENPTLAMKIMFYNRMVTRKTVGFFETEKVQKGQGAKDEFIKSLKWLENSHPEVLYSNLWIIPLVGSWKDLWYDSDFSSYYHYIKPEKVYELVAKGLKDEYNRGLIAKYLPRIRSKSNTKNDRHRRLNKWATGLCQYLGWSEKTYRKFKSNPENTAHSFQRVMCGNYWDELNFNTIPGKALFNLVTAKGKDGKTTLQRHYIEEKYIKWLQKQPTAKFTGYVYELFKAIPRRSTIPLAQKITYDKQFDGLVEQAKKDEGGITGNVFCALDTSGSMSCRISNETDVTAFDVCVSLGIFFSALNEGSFKDHVIMFDNHSKIKKITGNFTDKAQQIIKENTAWGSTNFQSVIDEIVRVRKSQPNIPLSDYPETILVVSDMQFNPVGGNTQTNYERAMDKLRGVGIEKMNFIWWYVQGRSSEVPNKMDDEGITIISGFDGAAVQLILGGETEVYDEKLGRTRKLNPYENMLKALDQELLNQLRC
jgi:hypothetical protein